MYHSSTSFRPGWVPNAQTKLLHVKKQCCGVSHTISGVHRIWTDSRPKLLRTPFPTQLWSSNSKTNAETTVLGFSGHGFNSEPEVYLRTCLPASTTNRKLFFTSQKVARRRAEVRHLLVAPVVPKMHFFREQSVDFNI